MSMEVDFNTPLTTRERAYLLERGRYADIERSDNAHGGETPEELLVGDGTGSVTRPLMTSEQQAERREFLLRELAALEGDDEETGGEDEEVLPYSEWKPAELKSEIERRNEALADEHKMAVSGTKAQLVERLEDDDRRAEAL